MEMMRPPRIDAAIRLTGQACFFQETSATMISAAPAMRSTQAKVVKVTWMLLNMNHPRPRVIRKKPMLNALQNIMGFTFESCFGD